MKSPQVEGELLSQARGQRLAICQIYPLLSVCSFPAVAQVRRISWVRRVRPVRDGLSGLLVTVVIDRPPSLDRCPLWSDLRTSPVSYRIYPAAERRGAGHNFPGSLSRRYKKASRCLHRRAWLAFFAI